MKKCPYCGTQIESVYRQTVCPKCSKALHSCLCCRFYHPGAHFDCLEDIDELVVEKDRANFCDSFSLTEKSISADTAQSREEKLRKDRAAFDALFKL